MKTNRAFLVLATLSIVIAVFVGLERHFARSQTMALVSRLQKNGVLAEAEAEVTLISSSYLQQRYVALARWNDLSEVFQKLFMNQRELIESSPLGRKHISYLKAAFRLEDVEQYQVAETSLDEGAASLFAITDGDGNVWISILK